MTTRQVPEVTIVLDGPAVYYVGDDKSLYRLDLTPPEASVIDERQSAIAAALLNQALGELDRATFARGPQ